MSKKIIRFVWVLLLSSGSKCCQMPIQKRVTRFLSCSQCLLRLSLYPAPVGESTLQGPGCGLIRITSSDTGRSRKRFSSKTLEHCTRRRSLSTSIQSQGSKLLLCKLYFGLSCLKRPPHIHVDSLRYVLVKFFFLA